jgi:hypothetical protein
MFNFSSFKSFVSETNLLAPIAISLFILPLISFEYIIVSPDLFNALAFSFFIYYIFGVLTPMISDFLNSSDLQYINTLSSQNTFDMLEAERNSFGSAISTISVDLVTDLVNLDFIITSEANAEGVDNDLATASYQQSVNSQHITEGVPIVTGVLYLQTKLLTSVGSGNTFNTVV